MTLIEKANIDSILENMTKLRHHLHEHPELSNEEYETSKLLKEYCQELDLEIRETENTGFIAILDTGKSGKTVGLRADMDALPVDENENNLAQKKAFVSNTPNVMHACGHDGHMSIQVGAMQILSEIKDELTGKIVFIFEEAEENNSGIHIMMDFLKSQNDLVFDAIYGSHVASFIDTGKIMVSPGPVMAAQRAFSFKVKGKGGHGSRPDQAINPIFVGSQILNAWTNAWANQVDVTKTVTLGVAEFHAGDTFNVIPGEATITGTSRYFDKAAGEEAFEILKDVATATAKAHKAEVEIDEKPKRFLQVVENDEQVTAIAREAIEELFDDAAISEPTWFASETFGYYQELAPICFTFVGIRNEALGSGAGHHNDQFDFDDAALEYGIKAMANFAVNYLNQ